MIDTESPLSDDVQEDGGERQKRRVFKKGRKYKDLTNDDLAGWIEKAAGNADILNAPKTKDKIMRHMKALATSDQSEEMKKLRSDLANLFVSCAKKTFFMDKSGKKVKETKADNVILVDIVRDKKGHYATDTRVFALDVLSQNKNLIGETLCDDPAEIEAVEHVYRKLYARPKPGEKTNEAKIARMQEQAFNVLANPIVMTLRLKEKIWTAPDETTLELLEYPLTRAQDPNIRQQALTLSYHYIDEKIKKQSDVSPHLKNLVENGGLSGTEEGAYLEAHIEQADRKKALQNEYATCAQEMYHALREGRKNDYAHAVKKGEELNDRYVAYKKEEERLMAPDGKPSAFGDYGFLLQYKKDKAKL